MGDGWRVTDDPESAPRPRRYAVLLWLLPLWLAASCVGGLWLYFKRQADAERAGPARFSTGVSEAGLRDDMAKLLGFVGERHVSHPDGVQGLKRAAAMIEGSLGPENAGYRVERLLAPAAATGQWPILIATVPGRDAKAAPLWLVAAYDSRPGSPGAEANASGTASLLAAANALANAAFARDVHFAFIPHAHDAEAPVADTLARLAARIGSATAVLVVEAAGSTPELLVSSRDAANPALRQVDGLGEVAGAEAVCLEDDTDLASLLFESGLPAARVATRLPVESSEPDATAPDPAVHTAATRALIELVERLAGS
jgi:hypothetical protein